MFGAVQGFTPNMSPEQIAELDRRRGRGDTGPFSDPEGIENKKPWLKPDGTHKSQDEDSTMSTTAEATQILKNRVRMPEEGEPFGKPTLPKREGESESERQVRSHVEDEKDNPGGYPGGRKQAVAIGLDMARRDKTEKSCDQGCTGACDHKGAHPVEKATNALKKYVVSSAPPPGAPPMPKPTGGPKPPQATRPKPPPIPGDAKSMGADDDDAKFADKLFGKSDEAEDIRLLETVIGNEKKEQKEEKELDKNMMPMSSPPPSIGAASAPMATSTMKALNSRSFFIPPPLSPYDPFGVMRNATTVPVVSAAVGEGVGISSGPDVLKSCIVHGTTFRGACGPCGMEKSQNCASCGTQMMKSFGGVLRCPRCR